MQKIFVEFSELYSRNDLSKRMTSITISNALGYMTASGEVGVEIGGENASLIAVWPEKGKAGFFCIVIFSMYALF